MKILIAKLLAHKLLLLVATSTVLDLTSTIQNQSRTRHLPPAGVVYLGTDGLLHSSPGRERDLTLGYPSNLQICLEVPAGVLVTLALGRKFPGPARKALIVESGIHFGGFIMNEAFMPKKYPQPVCLYGPGCLGTTIPASRFSR